MLNRNRRNRNKLIGSIRLLALVTFLFTIPEVRATHLVGGDLGYEFIGETAPGSGQFRYKLKLRLYINCGASSSYPSIIDVLGGSTTPLPVGVYDEDPNNPNAAKVLLTTGNIFLSTFNIITPPLPEGCSVGEGQCIEESLFDGEVILPASTSGYHLYFQAYARNEAIDNLVLPGEVGIGYYAFIPPTNIPNSSPLFSGVPVPFICIGDTTSFNTSATDPDGDSLVFSFEIPYAAQDENGGIEPPPFILNWPIVDVQFQSGYSPTAPFGAGGYANIDTNTGAVEYGAVLIGNWVVAIEVREYRNGQLIGRSRSDLQLLSTPCSPNIAPLPENNTITTSYQVVAGDTLCFPLAFTDEDGDTLNLIANGLIFDNGLYTPAATITGPLSGDSLLTSQFCWTPACSVGQQDPYTFSLLVSDDHCPPAIYQVVITIEVLPRDGAVGITGPAVACAGQGAAEYCFNGPAGAAYQWSVTNGTTTSTLTDPCISVEWPGSGIGTLELVAVDAQCTWTIDLDVFAQEAPEASFALDLDTFCTGITAKVFDILPQGGQQLWYVNSQLSSIGSLETILPLGFSTTNEITLIASNQFGCSDTVSQQLVIGSYDQSVQYYIPNVFSPNGDGKNDRFILASQQDMSACVLMRIYDRWGKLLYETDNGSLGWNGKNSGGTECAQTAYFYRITVGDVEYHGYVDLLR